MTEKLKIVGSTTTTAAMTLNKIKICVISQNKWI